MKPGIKLAALSVNTQIHCGSICQTVKAIDCVNDDVGVFFRSLDVCDGYTADGAAIGRLATALRNEDSMVEDDYVPSISDACMKHGCFGRVCVLEVVFAYGVVGRFHKSGKDLQGFVHRKKTRECAHRYPRAVAGNRAHSMHLGRIKDDEIAGFGTDY